MRNVIKKSVKKRLNMYESIFFILNMPVFLEQQNYFKKFNNQLFKMRNYFKCLICKNEICLTTQVEYEITFNCTWLMTTSLY